MTGNFSKVNFTEMEHIFMPTVTNLLDPIGLERKTDVEFCTQTMVRLEDDRVPEISGTRPEISGTLATRARPIPDRSLPDTRVNTRGYPSLLNYFFQSDIFHWITTQIRKNPEKSGKILKNSEKFRKIPKNSKKF